jgi:N-formylglutamate deformylase
MTPWLKVHRGNAPLIVSFPHSGTELAPQIEARIASSWLARKDTDWYVHQLYDCAQELGASTVRTALSRTVIDVNRDPTGVSLYPGQATTELCPLTTFDGEVLYVPGTMPDAAETADRRRSYFDPYHAALGSELERLRQTCDTVVLYDAHSIRSRVPRLFPGVLANFNIGTNDGASCAPALTHKIESVCDDTGFSRVTNGRFRGGWITRHYGRPDRGIHAMQMELACRSYLDEPQDALSPENWPALYDAARAAGVRKVLHDVLCACIEFARSRERTRP